MEIFEVLRLTFGIFMKSFYKKVIWVPGGFGITQPVLDLRVRVWVFRKLLKFHLIGLIFGKSWKVSRKGLIFGTQEFWRLLNRFLTFLEVPRTLRLFFGKFWKTSRKWLILVQLRITKLTKSISSARLGIWASWRQLKT